MAGQLVARFDSGLRWAILLGLVVAPVTGYATPFVLMGVAAFAGVRFLYEREFPPSGTGVSIGMTLTALFLIILATLATVLDFADLLPLFGFVALLFHASLAALFARDANPLGTRRLADVMLAGAGVALIMALIYRFGFGQVRAGEGAPLIDPHRLASFAITFGTLALMGWRERRRWLYALGPLFALGTIILTGSRAGLFALPILLVIALILLGRRRAVGVAIAAAILVAGVATVLLVPLPGTDRTTLFEAAAQYLGNGSVADAAIAVRLKIYALGWHAVSAQPVYGYGWAHLMNPIAPQLIEEQQDFGPIPHLHDDMLNFAVAGGRLGIAAWLLVLAAPFVAALRAPQDTQAVPRTYGLAVLGASALLLGLPDTLLSAPASLTVFTVLLAVLSGWCRDTA